VLVKWKINKTADSSDITNVLWYITHCNKSVKHYFGFAKYSSCLTLVLLKLVHTADTDKTKLSCLVRVDGVNKLLQLG